MVATPTSRTLGGLFDVSRSADRQQRVWELQLGPVVGILLLLLTSASFNVVNLIAGIVYMVAMPFVAVATTYLYYDVNVRSVLEDRAAVGRRELSAEI